MARHPLICRVLGSIFQHIYSPEQVRATLLPLISYDHRVLSPAATFVSFLDHNHLLLSLSRYIWCDIVTISEACRSKQT